MKFLLGACHLLRRNVYERIGPLNEGVHFWGCDMDWCMTVAGAGYRQAVLTCSRIMHVGGAATQKKVAIVGDNRKRVWGQYTSYIDVLRKHRGPAHMVAAKFVVGVSSAVRVLAFLPLIAMPPLHRRSGWPPASTRDCCAAFPGM